MAGLDDGSPPPTDGTRRWGRLLAACVAALALLLGAGLGTARAADGGSTTATAAEPATAAASGSAPATESTTTTQSTTTQEATAAEPAKTTEPAPSAPTQAAPTEAAPTEAAPTEAAPSQPTPTEPVPPAAAAPAPAKPPEASPPPEPAAPPTPPAPTPQPPAQPIVLLVVPAAPPQPAPPPPAPTDPPPAPPVAPPIGAGAAAEVIHAEFEVAATLAGPTLPNELTWIAPAVAVPTAASSVVVVDSQPVRGAPGAQLETGAHGRLASAEAPREPAMHRDVRKSAPHRPAPRSTDDHAPLPPVPTHPAGAGAGSAPDGGGGGVTSAVGARTSDPVPTLVLVLHHAAKTPHSSQALGLRIERPG